MLHKEGARSRAARRERRKRYMALEANTEKKMVEWKSKMLERDLGKREVQA